MVTKVRIYIPMLISCYFIIAWENDDNAYSKSKYKGKEPTFEYKPTLSYYGNTNTGSSTANKNLYTNIHCIHIMLMIVIMYIH